MTIFKTDNTEIDYKEVRMGIAIINTFKTKQEAKAYLDGYIRGLNYITNFIYVSDYVIFYEPSDYPDKPYTLNLK